MREGTGAALIPKLQKSAQRKKTVADYITNFSTSRFKDPEISLGQSEERAPVRVLMAHDNLFTTRDLPYPP